MKIEYGFLALIWMFFLLTYAAITYGAGVVRGYEQIEEKCTQEGYFLPRSGVIIQCRPVPYQRLITQLKGTYHG